MSYHEDRLKRKNGLAPVLPTRKEKKPIPKVSKKRAEQMKEKKKELGEDDTIKEKWFKARRKEMVGICQCGCSRKSSKNDNDNFRSSIAHIFPKATFKSIQYHKLNWVERTFWEGCHTNFDTKGLDLWPMYADWEDIKERFFILAPLLTDEEKATKFYQKLESLVYSK